MPAQRARRGRRAATLQTVTVTHTGDLVSALLGVPGVAAAAVEPTAAGPGTLRLQLLPGADEVGVAGAVNRILRSRFGLAVDADRVRVLGETDDGTPGDGSATGPAAEPESGAGRPATYLPAAAAPPRPPTTPDALLEALRRTRPRRRRRRRSAARPRRRVAGAGHGPVHRLGRAARGGRPAPGATAPVAPVRAAAPTDAPTPATGGRPRLVIERVQLVSAGLTTSVTVVLGHDGRTVQGTAEGTATTGSLHRSVAAATLRAVESVVGEGVRFDVEHVEVARTGPDRTALVVLTMVTERATQRLSGASVVREDVRQAVIRAVLAAVNRRVEPLIPGAGDAPA